MPLFRKKETYNEQMLREAGLNRVVFNPPPPVADTSEPTVPEPLLGRPNITGHGPVLGVRPWDAVNTVLAPGIDGDSVSFVVLPNGDLIIDSEEGDGDLTPLADAIEQNVTPPYRARASRQEGDLWGVGAKRIDVAEFAFPDAETLELSQSDGVGELRIDGGPTDVAPPVELQRLGEEAGADFSVEASRIDGDFWEVRVSPL